MTADRDALAQIIQEASIYRLAYWEAGEAADAILAAGWRPPEAVHRHEWAPAGFLTAAAGHRPAPRWSCACGAFRFGVVSDAVDS